MKYYYPLCSKDFCFENIFATESISPPSYYSSRQFGFDYFYKIDKVHNENALILYKKPPLYDAGTLNSTAFKFIVELDDDYLLDDYVTIIDQNIIAYRNTIYLNKNNFILLFFSELEKNLAYGKSEISLPTKDLKKYTNNFRIITPDICEPFDVTNLNSFIVENDTQTQITNDRIFNFFKGFIYGVLSESYETSKSEIILKKSIQEIKNSFGELVNRTSNNESLNLAKSNKYLGSAKNSPELFISNASAAIDVTEKLLKNVFPAKHVTENELAAFLYQKYQQHLPTLDAAKSYLSFKILDDKIFGTNYMEALHSQYFQNLNNKDVFAHLNELRALVKSYINKEYAKEYSKLNDITNRSVLFKSELNEISLKINEELSKSGPIKIINLELLKLNSQLNKIEIADNIAIIKDKDLEEYLLILNIIYNNPKKGKGEINKEQILNIIEEVGIQTSNLKSGKQTHLYKYINNEVAEYNIQSVSSVVMKNFVAFIFNPDSLERIQKFIEQKELEKGWIGYSFWGLFNGFANMSKDFLHPVFGNNQTDLQDYVDKYLRQTYLAINTNLIELKATSATNVQQDTPKEKEQTKQDLTFIKKVYEEFKSDLYELTLAQFSVIMQIDNKEKVINELKKQGKVLKKDGKKIYDSYKNLMIPTIGFK